VSTAEPNQYPDPEGPDEYPTLLEEPAAQEFPTLHEPAESAGPAGRPRGAANRIDLVSVGAGLVFFLIGGAYLLASGGHLTVNAGWTFSLLLLGLGLSGVIGAVLGRSRRGGSGRR